MNHVDALIAFFILNWAPSAIAVFAFMCGWSLPQNRKVMLIVIAVFVLGGAMAAGVIIQHGSDWVYYIRGDWK